MSPGHFQPAGTRAARSPAVPAPCGVVARVPVLVLSHRPKETEMTTIDQLPLDDLMELATPLLREALDLPPEQAAVTTLGRRIRAEVERIYTAGRAQAFRDAAQMIRDCKPESTRDGSQRALEAYQLSVATALRITADLTKPADGSQQHTG